jgi:flavodoxin
MNKLTAILLVFMMIFGLAGCVSSTPIESNQPISETSENTNGTQSNVVTSNEYSEKKILTVYFSRTGNTERLAEMIASSLNTDIFVIDPVAPYTDTYEATLATAGRERSENTRPEYIGIVENMNDYDTIMLGYPIWGGALPMIVHTFLEDYDFTGKTIFPFWSSNHGGYFNTINIIETALPNSVIGEGFSIRGSEIEEAQESINDWLSRLGVVN